MDKKAVMYVAAALVIILVVALVIKPIMAKPPLNNDVSSSPASTQPGVTAGTGQNVSANSSTAAPENRTPVPTTMPKPTPTRNLSVQSVGFVDPSTYHLTVDQQIPNGIPINQTPYRNTNLTTIATIAGQFSGTTQTFEIPYPYWELWYTVQPSVGTAPGKADVTPAPTSGGSPSGVSSSGITGSYSTTFPEFTLQVMDASDPNRIVRTITPPGGIDLDLWLGNKKAITNPQDNAKSNQLNTNPDNVPYNDPRPWVEKFFEGQRSYYFVVSAHSLDSYSIQIRVPSGYVGKY